MRVLMCVIAVLVLMAVPAQKAGAAAQFTLWPAQFAYGTPPGDFAWNSTMFGLRIDEPLGPFVSLQSNLRYGSAANLTFAGSGLSGYNGNTWLADSAVRVGLRTGPVGFAAFGGYGGLFFNAKGPSASDNVVLRSLASRLGVEATVATSGGLTLRGTYAWITSLTANADFSITPNPPQSFSGNGSGSDYEILLQYSPVPLTTVFAGYRGGSSQISWSVGPTSNSTFQGYLVGVELHF